MAETRLWFKSIRKALWLVAMMFVCGVFITDVGFPVLALLPLAMPSLHLLAMNGNLISPGS